MKIALISDIHANLIAFETVLTDLEKDNPDQVVCLGDVATTGPHPAQTIERLKSLNIITIMGNNDAWLLNPPPITTQNEALSPRQAIKYWCADQLSVSDFEYLQTFKKSITINLTNNKRLCCFHGSPNSHSDVILATTPNEDLDAMLATCKATVMAGGHTHEQLLRSYQLKLIINPGSVGLPFVKLCTRVRDPNLAQYAMLLGDGERIRVEFRGVKVDVDKIIEAGLNSGMPYAEIWANCWR